MGRKEDAPQEIVTIQVPSHVEAKIRHYVHAANREPDEQIRQGLASVAQNEFNRSPLADIFEIQPREDGGIELAVQKGFKRSSMKDEPVYDPHYPDERTPIATQIQIQRSAKRARST